MLRIPKILDTPEFLDAPLNYKWDEKTSEFYFVDAYNDKIAKAFLALNHKATFGLAVALGEWVFWRISNHIDKEKLFPVFESHWVWFFDTIIIKTYFDLIDYQLTSIAVYDPVLRNDIFNF